MRSGVSRPLYISGDKIKYDSVGNPILPLDSKGNPIIEFTLTGVPIIPLDADGDPVFIIDGNVIRLAKKFQLIS